VFFWAGNGDELPVLGAQEMRETHGGFEVVIEDVGISPDFDLLEPGSGIGAEMGPLIGCVMGEPEDAGGGWEEAVEVEEGRGLQWLTVVGSGWLLLFQKLGELGFEDGEVVEVVGDGLDEVVALGGGGFEGEEEDLAAGGPWLEGVAVPEVAEGVAGEGGGAGSGGGLFGISHELAVVDVVYCC